MTTVEKKASSVEQAIKLCLEELNITEDQADIEIVSNGGLFTKAVVKASKKITAEDKAQEFINTLLGYMGLECTAEQICTADGQHYINISGRDNGIAIGYRGEVLDAMQYITLLSINSGKDDFAKISLNSESYREKRTQTLTELARKLADKVVRTGRAVELEPMNPFERRIVHTALQGNDKVTSDSIGVEPNRHIVIKLVGSDSHNSNYGEGSGTSYNFRRNGPQKTRSFGQKSRKPF